MHLSNIFVHINYLFNTELKLKKERKKYLSNLNKQNQLKTDSMLILSDALRSKGIFFNMRIIIYFNAVSKYQQLNAIVVVLMVDGLKLRSEA